MRVRAGGRACASECPVLFVADVKGCSAAPGEFSPPAFVFVLCFCSMCGSHRLCMSVRAHYCGMNRMCTWLLLRACVRARHVCVRACRFFPPLRRVGARPGRGSLAGGNHTPPMPTPAAATPRIPPTAPQRLFVPQLFFRSSCHCAQPTEAWGAPFCQRPEPKGATGVSEQRGSHTVGQAAGVGRTQAPVPRRDLH